MLGRWGMANRPAPGLSISEFERLELQRLTRSSSVSAGLAKRARIVLLAGQGLSNTAIAERVGVSRPTVIAWRSRFVGRGLAGQHRHTEFLRFLKQVAKAYPRVKLHVVADNYATHKHPCLLYTSPSPRDGLLS